MCKKYKKIENKEKEHQKMVYKICKYCSCRFENKSAKCPGCGSRDYILEYVDDPDGKNIKDIEYKIVVCPTCEKINYLGSKKCVKCGSNLPTQKDLDTKRLNQLKDSNGKINRYPETKDKRIVLEYLTSKFSKDKRYSEKEVNQILVDWINFVDYITIRRDLIDGNYLNRESDGNFYCVSAKSNKKE